jgi:signal transduction histidine kinase
LSKINAELDRFVYSASHDLRAPIASLLGLIEVARLEKNMENMERLLDMQQKSLQRLDNFIKDIVDHSRNMRLQVELEEVDFEKDYSGIVRTTPIYGECQSHSEKYYR